MLKRHLVNTRRKHSLFINKMKKINTEEQFRSALESFYLGATKNFSLKYTLKNRLKRVVDNVRKEWDMIPDVESRSVKLKTPTNKQSSSKTLDENSSLKLMQTPKSNQLTISRSISKMSKSKDSNEISQSDAKSFNSEWIYQSGCQEKAIFFCIMSSMISTDNKFAFKFLEEKVNNLILSHDFSQTQLVNIGQNWQRIGDLLAQSKTLRWQKILKESVDKLPDTFAELSCKCVFGTDSDKALVLDELMITKLSAELKVTINYFVINFREIEVKKMIGKFGKQSNIGMIDGSKFVIATKPPEYKKQDLHLRALRNSFKDTIKELVSTYDNNNKAYEEFNDLQSCDKGDAVVEHFKSRMVGTYDE